MFKAKGILEFNPVDYTKKHKSQSTWKCTAMIKTDCDLSDYYAWFLKTRFNLKLNPTLRGTHITFINDRMDKDLFNEGSKIFNGREITFEYDPINMRSNAKHWWMNVKSTEAEDIREALGLDRKPYFGLHMTLGIANPKFIDHSKYILECCKFFNL